MRLEQGPFTVRLAESGAAALAVLAEEAEVDLLILDLMLPHMNGVELLQAIRATPRFAALPCIVLTAVGQDEPIRDVLALGVSDVMTKPFSPRRLFARALSLTGRTDADEPWGATAATPASRASA
jgi:DNA-binding response OmpR family regulator